MARQRKGNPVSGWVIVDKSSGPTSTRVVGAVRRAFSAQKAGHAGTLDPLATGVLAVALGEATKTIPFIQEATKTYRFTLRWGQATATDDCEGPVVETSPHRPQEAEIRAALNSFVGEINQVPPQFSAILLAGERAYDLARAGTAMELKARPVTIHEARLISLPDADHAGFEIICGKGTYVRALARDLGQALGTCAHVTALCRTRVGPFSQSAAIPLDKLAELGHDAPASRPLPEQLGSHLLPLETALDDIPALAVSSDDAARLRRGQAVLVRGRDAPILQGRILATYRGDPVALTEFTKGDLRPVRVFNLS